MINRENTQAFKKFIREPFVFPGGYAWIMLAKDGGAICHKCAKENARLILESTRRNCASDWEYIGAFINWEDADLYCSHCNEKIKAEYIDDDQEE